jgi:hypothetical protein
MQIHAGTRERLGECGAKRAVRASYEKMADGRVKESILQYANRMRKKRGMRRPGTKSFAATSGSYGRGKVRNRGR